MSGTAALPSRWDLTTIGLPALFSTAFIDSKQLGSFVPHFYVWFGSQVFKSAIGPSACFRRWPK
jgi:hypothetical protein